MAGADRGVALCGGGAGQQRRQGFTGERAAWPQVGGLGESPGSFAGGEVQPVGQRVAKFSAQFVAGGLPGKLIDQLMARHRPQVTYDFSETAAGSGGDALGCCLIKAIQHCLGHQLVCS